MRQHIRITPIIAALLCVACGGQSSMDEQMRRDLEAASAPTIELAPSGGRQRVVSAIEQVQPVQPTQTKSRRVNTATQDPPPAASPSAEPAAARPMQRPAVSPPPPGGYKTVDEVIRNAPFPIKPANKRPPR